MDTPLARLQRNISPTDGSFADHLLAGLAKSPKEIACKFFYDQAGSRLFDRICEQPEYYQTRTETMLLTRHAREIAALIGDGVEIVEFGAGSLRKVRILLDALHAPRAYTPLDISGDYLAEVVHSLAADYPALTLRPLVGDFSQPLDIPALPEIGRPDDDYLESLRPSLVASPRTGRDAHRVPFLELDDLVVELHPTTPAHDDVHLFLLLVCVAVRKAIAGRDALVAQAGFLELERDGRQAELQVRRAVESRADVLQILDVPERERHGSILWNRRTHNQDAWL